MRRLLFAVCFLLAPPLVHAQDEGPRLLWIRAVGDVMLGTDFPSPDDLPPNDGADLLGAVAPWLRDADVTFANLEGPFIDGGTTDKCDTGAHCYAFRTPTRYAAYLRDAGIDLASTANNHAHDFGEEGQHATEAVLDALGIAWSGRPGTTATLVRRGLRIGLAAFHTSRTGNDLNDHAAAADLVRSLDADHDLVLVSFHGGAEGSDALHVPEGREFYLGEDRGDLRAFARTVVDAGADLVLGHGPHIPRGMEVYRDRLVAYSLGNFATYGRFNLRGNLGIGLILEAVLDDTGRFVSGRILPTYQEGEGIPKPDPIARAVSLVRRLSEEDFPDTYVRVGGDGRLLPAGGYVPLRPFLVPPAPPVPLPTPAPAPL